MVGLILEKRGHLPLTFICTGFPPSSKPTGSMAVVGRDTTRLMSYTGTDGNDLSLGVSGGAMQYPLWMKPIIAYPIFYNGHSRLSGPRHLQLAPPEMC